MYKFRSVSQSMSGDPLALRHQKFLGVMDKSNYNLPELPPPMVHPHRTYLIHSIDLSICHCRHNRYRLHLHLADVLVNRLSLRKS